MTTDGWIAAWSPDGYRMSIPLGATREMIETTLAAIRDLGLLPREPGTEPGQENEYIGAVMRRASSDGTPIIDFYPDWSHGGKFGEHKWAHMYINNPDDVTQFEAQSGLKLNNIPLYDGQQALKRTYGKPHDKETIPARRFQIARIPDGQHDTGMPKYRYAYTLPIAPDAPKTDPDTGEIETWVNAENVSKLRESLHKNGLTDDDINAIVGADPRHWGRWNTGKAAAIEIKTEWEKKQAQTPPAQPKNGKQSPPPPPEYDAPPLPENAANIPF